MVSKNISAHHDKAPTLGNFFEACLDYRLEFALTLPFCGLTLEDFRGFGILVPVKTSKYTIQVRYADDGKTYFQENQDLSEIELGPDHLMENGEFNLQRIISEFKLQRHQSPWASFLLFFRILGEEEATHEPKGRQACNAELKKAKELARWEIWQAGARAGRVLFEASSMLDAWNKELSKVVEHTSETVSEEIPSPENVELVGVPLQDTEQMMELEEQFLTEIECRAQSKEEAAKEKAKFLRMTIARNLNQVTGHLSKYSEPTFSHAHYMYLCGFMDALLITTDPSDYTGKWQERFKTIHNQIRSAEAVNGRWSRQENELKKALAEARREWENGSKLFHHQMADLLILKYDLSKPILLKALRPIALQYGRLRGVKKS
jgi:hypothetical protein